MTNSMGSDNQLGDHVFGQTNQMPPPMMHLDGTIDEEPSQSDNSHIVIGPKRDKDKLFSGLESGNSIFNR